MSTFLSHMALRTYAGAGYAVQPAAGLLLHWRARRGKEDRSRLRERYGIASEERNASSVVWVHAASLGETKAVMPLVQRIVDMGFQVVLTTVTTSAARFAATELPEGACHQFAPLDLKSYVSRFLEHWRPALAIFVESEIWPTMMTELRRHQISQVIVNARMSERSFRRWKAFGTVTHNLFDNISLCVAQTDEYATRFSELGVHSVISAGNMKFDTAPPIVDPEQYSILKGAIGDRPVWLAASTHDKEEMIVARAHTALKKLFPNLLTIIAPRHPERAAAILDALRKGGLTVSRRSEGQLPEALTDIYLADTFGELGLFYNLVPCSLVGGSLVPHGGQNPIEPARLGTAIIHGPNVANFSTIFKALEEGGGSSCVRNGQELVHTVADVLANQHRKVRMTKAADAVLGRFGGALERTHKVLLPYLNPLILAGRLSDHTTEA